METKSINHPSPLSYFGELERLTGSRHAAAIALGYSDRRYRDFRNNKVRVPVAVRLAVERLLELGEIINETSPGDSQTE